MAWLYPGKIQAFQTSFDRIGGMAMDLVKDHHWGDAYDPYCWTRSWTSWFCSILYIYLRYSQVTVVHPKCKKMCANRQDRYETYNELEAGGGLMPKRTFPLFSWFRNSCQLFWLCKHSVNTWWMHGICYVQYLQNFTDICRINWLARWIVHEQHRQHAPFALSNSRNHHSQMLTVNVNV